MKTVLITSSLFAGEVEIRFQHGIMHFLEMRASFNEKQALYVFKRLPFLESEIPHLNKTAPDFKYTEVKHELTFDMFWRKYDNKALSSKKRAQTKWERMNKAMRQKAYYYIDTYFASMPHGVEKKYAETYLNSEIWDQ